uniref:EF-hand domain-containing protein n=1 Tax=Alexandrium monilatum TaxID=311494 RepID=A0A7S4V8T6_9DINO
MKPIHSGFMSAISARHNSGSDQGQTSPADWVYEGNQAALLSIDPEDTRAHTEGILAKMPKGREVVQVFQEKLHAELSRLLATEAEQQERLNSLGAKRDELAALNKNTQAEIEKTRESLRAMTVQTTEEAIVSKQEELQEAEDLMVKLQEQQESTRAAYVRSQKLLGSEIAESNGTIYKLQRDIYFLEYEQREGHERPGPYCLRWVEDDGFMLLSTVVIMSNLMTSLLQITHPGLDFAIWDQFFMAFYTVELILNLIVKQRYFVCGQFSNVWMNWLDILTVTSGILECVLNVNVKKDNSMLGMVRCVRFTRIMRITKIIRLLATSDLSWANGHMFQAFMMAVIGLNTIVMGIEMEFPTFFLWPYMENGFLLIFVFELLVRMRIFGARFLCELHQDILWNWIDLIVVLGGVFDNWVMPSLITLANLMGMNAHHSGELAHFMAMVRMARLARVLRLIRLVKNIPPLYTLVVGIAKAMQGMGWVFILTVGVLYICAVIGVQLVGQGWALPPSLTNDELREAEDTFDDIPDAVFNLFKAMNADLGAFGPLFHAVPGSKWVMMAFMIVMNWAIFSILTAVVSDNMSKATEAHGREEEERAAAEASERRAKLIELVLSHLDKDGNGEISLREVEELFRDEVEVEALRALTGLEEEDIHGILELVENEGGGTITHADFRALMQHGYSEVTAHSLMKFETRLHGLERLLTRAANGRMRRHSTL